MQGHTLLNKHEFYYITVLYTRLGYNISYIFAYTLAALFDHDYSRSDQLASVLYIAKFVPIKLMLL